MTTVEDVKGRVRIEELIQEDGYELEGRAGNKYWRGVQHNSLVVDVRNQAYFWNSRGEKGDVFDWCKHRRGWDFKTALVELAQRAGLDAPSWSEREMQEARARRSAEETLAAAVEFFREGLWASPEALAYCRGRGWDDETIKEARLGFADGDREELAKALRVAGADTSSPVARAVLGFPKGMIVYPHMERGRIGYVSGRSIEGKQHYNPPIELMGPRRVFFNHECPGKRIVVVEGQASAITLGVWGIPAVALAGVAASGMEGVKLEGQQVFVGLDADEAGEKATGEVARKAGLLCRIVRWPAKDANDWLQDGATADDCEALLSRSPEAVEVWAQQAAGDDEAIRGFFTMLVERLDEFDIEFRKPELATALGVGIRKFNNLLKATRKEQSEEDEGQWLDEVVTPGGYVDGRLFEMVVEGEGEKRRSKFAVREQDGKVQMLDCVKDKDRQFVPVSARADLVAKGVVLFPSGVGELKTTQEVVSEIQEFIHRYLDVDEFYEKMASYYVIFTWLYDCFNVIPYLRALGDYGTGKTRFVQAIGVLCYRPMFAGGASTTSPIFRIIDKMRGTLLLDEADFNVSDESVEIIKILNTGYMKGFPVLRSEKVGDNWEVSAADVFCPKIIATRKRYGDRALESRLLTYEMNGVPRPEIPVVLPSCFWEEAQRIRNDLLRYRLAHWQPNIEVDYNQAAGSVEPRLNQVTLALKRLVDDPTLVEGINEFIVEYNRQLIVERSMTLESFVLEAIVELQRESGEVDLYGNVQPDLRLKTIAKRVNEKLDEDNEVDEEERKTPKITPRGIGSMMHRMGLRTERQGKSRNYVVIWDGQRIDALKGRFGVE